MPLRGRLVVTPALREGKTMVHSGVKLDLPGGAGIPKQHPELFDHRQRRQIVMLGTGYVELAFYLPQ
jgi:hypothetical protein